MAVAISHFAFLFFIFHFVPLVFLTLFGSYRVSHRLHSPAIFIFLPFIIYHARCFIWYIYLPTSRPSVFFSRVIFLSPSCARFYDSFSVFLRIYGCTSYSVISVFTSNAEHRHRPARKNFLSHPPHHRACLRSL